MTPRRSSGSWLESLRHRLEPLWAAALAIDFFVLGRAIAPLRIVYILLLVGYLPLVCFIARPLPRLTSRQTASGIRLGIVGIGLIELAFYLLFANWIFELSAVMAAIVTIVALGYAGGRQSSNTRGSSFVRMLPVLLASAFAWMCAGSLVSWGDALEWIASTPRTATLMVLSIALVAFGLREQAEHAGDDRRLEWWDYVAIGALVIFSFRTVPFARLDQWASLLIPLDDLSQNSAVTFWLLQSIALAACAVIIYIAVRHAGSKWMGPPFALIVAFSTLFFIPRNGQELVASQMLPSWGPLRFIWCFVLLAFVARFYFLPPDRQTTREFVFVGTTIWLGSVVWSAESAAYCTAIWLASLGVFTAQRTAVWREAQLPSGETSRRVAQILLTPPVALGAIVIIVTAAHLARFGSMPDWRGYWQPAFASGNPVDPTGPAWYLMLLLAVLSMTAAMTLSRDPRDARLVPLAGLWAGFWAVGNFFIANTEPIRAAILVPLVLFMLATAIRIIRSDRTHRWHRVVIAALVPAFAMPIAILLGHARFASEVTRRQVSPFAIKAEVQQQNIAISPR